MDFLNDWITSFITNMLVDGIMGNLAGLFDGVNRQVGEVAAQVGTPPDAWNPGVLSLIRSLSETVVLPIAGLLLTFIAAYELISMIVDRNNLNEVDTWMFFRWFFKTFVAVTVLSNTHNIVMAVFDMAQHIISSSSGLVGNSTAVTLDMMGSLEADLRGMGTGRLVGLWLQTVFVGLTMHALNIVIFIIVYGRLIEIYMLTSLAPIPLATLTNREFGGMGQNYLKSLLAIGFQGFLIMVCIAIYAVLVQNIATDGGPALAIWKTAGYTVLLCFTLFKTGGIAKSVLGAH